MPNGKFSLVAHRGSCRITGEGKLQNVLFVPAFQYNLLSVYYMDTIHPHVEKSLVLNGSIMFLAKGHISQLSTVLLQSSIA